MRRVLADPGSGKRVKTISVSRATALSIHRRRQSFKFHRIQCDRKRRLRVISITGNPDGQNGYWGGEMAGEGKASRAVRDGHDSFLEKRAQRVGPVVADLLRVHADIE